MFDFYRNIWFLWKHLIFYVFLMIFEKEYNDFKKQVSILREKKQGKLLFVENVTFLEVPLLCGKKRVQCPLCIKMPAHVPTPPHPRVWFMGPSEQSFSCYPTTNTTLPPHSSLLTTPSLETHIAFEITQANPLIFISPPNLMFMEHSPVPGTLHV